jgi:hypothetical protein
MQTEHIINNLSLLYTFCVPLEALVLGSFMFSSYNENGMILFKFVIYKYFKPKCNLELLTAMHMGVIYPINLLTPILEVPYN